MTTTGLRRVLWSVSVMLALFVAASGYWFVRHAWLDVQGGLAEEQTMYFEECREKALASSQPGEMVDCIEGAMRYYPSGTKQTKGSHLDGMVERARRLTVEAIVAHLKRTTKTDLGDDPQRWIEKYRKVDQQGGTPKGAAPPQ